MTITEPDFLSIIADFLPKHEGKSTKLVWVSDDGAASVALGCYDSEELALRDVVVRIDELLSFCTDDDARATVHAGHWELQPVTVTPVEVKPTGKFVMVQFMYRTSFYVGSGWFVQPEDLTVAGLEVERAGQDEEKPVRGGVSRGLAHAANKALRAELKKGRR